MTVHPVLIGGAWREAQRTAVFQAENPASGERLPDAYPVSTWADCDAALAAAAQAAGEMRHLSGETIGRFLEHYAAAIEKHAADIVAAAHLETAYPKSPRLADVELPRTTNQLRQAAAAAREGSWALPTIDSKADIRSVFAPLGPVFVLGPNNFPLAFGSISGGDFSAAIAAGNPVIAKAHPSHPTTTRLFAELAQQSATGAGLPAGALQLLYKLGHADGLRMVADPRLGATAYTGSRSAGLRLKAAADVAGKPIYLELSSINPVVVLPGALAERADQIATEFTASCLMGTGQFCTNPGLVILLAGQVTEAFIALLVERFRQAPAGVLLARSVLESLEANLRTLADAGAHALVGGRRAEGPGYRHENTLLRVSGKHFLAHPEALQTEAFGNASLLVVVDDPAQLTAVLAALEGNLTGSVYSDAAGRDDAMYSEIEPLLRERAGRLLNDKMPTGVAVSPAMVHGGPYPATGHPGYTAVGIPASMLRFAALQCYDNVREQRLPAALRNQNPGGRMWRKIDGAWTQLDVPQSC